MTTFADHQQPRTDNGRFATIVRTEASVALDELTARPVTAADVVNRGGENAAAGRLMVAQTRQAIEKFGPQPFPTGIHAGYVVEQYFPTGTKVVENASTDEEASRVSIEDDGAVRWVLEGDEDGDELTTDELMWPVSITHIP